MKKLLLLIICVVLLSGCSLVDSISRKIDSSDSDTVQTPQDYISAVKNALIKDTSYTYEAVFNKFFDNPKWKHYTDEESQQIVEFTGNCVYNKQTVQAEIHFMITTETDNYIKCKVNYLGFDNVSQPLSKMTDLLQKAVDKYENKPESTNIQQNKYDYLISDSSYDYIENCVSTRIRPIYSKITSNENFYTKTSSGGATLWHDNGILCKKEFSQGALNYNMARQYYYDTSHAELVFAFVFRENQEHRYYFDKGKLIRYIGVDGNIINNPSDVEILKTADRIINEAY